MSTTERMPARAAAAATALARLPVDGQASTLKPSSIAAASATPTTRSLNECVGLDALILDPQLAHPEVLASWSARTSRVQPGSRFGLLATSGGTGSRLAYRHMLSGPDCTDSLVRAGRS